MVRKFINWLGVLILSLILIPSPAQAQDINIYLLRTADGVPAQAVCQRYGMALLRNLDRPSLYLVSMSSSVEPETLKRWVKDDPEVKNLEPQKQAHATETNLSNTDYLPTGSVTTALSDRRSAKLYGANVWVGYVEQPALSTIGAKANHLKNIAGAGTIAIIDTGVDPRHPALAAVLLPGYDFTRDLPGTASELRDLNQSTAAILEQSTTAILEQSTTAILEGSQVIRLNQSTAAILEQSTASILEGQQLPAYFGHGTMVTGLVHAVAPKAKIMPLKAFNADGSARLSDIVRAIYYATDNGAKVINMSFRLPDFSDELMRAINYASRKGVICLSSAGNENQRALGYPAALGNVMGIASTNNLDERSAFSNYGADLVALAAPGEALVTTYPGGHYAAVWGSSFSSALAAGGAALLVDAVSGDTSVQLAQDDARRAFSKAAPLPDPDLGAGRLDLGAAVEYIKKLVLPK